ncbi:MAG TPA: SH3 domain-containing protein [Roseiflexaceae bacterium]|nr:SH3 domain-containing protein [Roseiflexaceae bacterium]
MDVLLNPIVLAAIVIVLVVAVLVLVLIRRRRAAEALPPPEIGETIDYTSLPFEEPTSLGDRFRNASPAVKVLAVLVPLVVIGVIAALALTFFQSGGAGDGTAVLPPPTITNVSAEVAGAGKIVVRADTTLPDGAAVSATMKQGDQDFPWFDPDTAVATANAGKITLTLERRQGAPTPQQGQEYRVALVSTLPDGSLVTSDPVPVTVLPTFAADFFQTAAPQPTAAPTDVPPTVTAEQATATPAPEATPTVEATAPLTATVRNGGNIRREPNRQGEVLGQVSAGEVVELIARSPDGQWYLLRATEAEGWVSATLLAVPEDVAAQVPQEVPASAPTARVFNGGNVRAAPNLQGEVLDQIHAGETVQLLARTENGTWFLIINPRQITGWVSATLLEVALEDRRALPVSSDPVATPLPATREALPGPPTPAPVTPEAAPPSTGLTAIVFNGGNVRAAPNLQGEVLDQIHARETVQLLAKTADGNWYQITNVRGVTGWVNRTLLTVDPEVARRVPVA